jgi:hypothetical protein
MTRYRLSCIVALAGACAAGGGPPGEAPARSPRGRLRPARGRHPRVAVFASFPPVGEPIAEVAIDEPRFPQAYQVRGVPPGRYFVLAMVDGDPDDGDRYRPRTDPGGAFGTYLSPAAVTITTLGPASAVDITLEPPMAGSPWDR